MDLFLRLLSGLAMSVVAFFALAAVLVFAALAVDAFRGAWRRRRRRLAPRPPVVPADRWQLTLLVHVDDESSLVRPSVQIRGESVQEGAFVRLDLADERGVVRLRIGRALPPDAIGSELPLPAFVPPRGIQLDDVLRWTWDVVLVDPTGERARWREHPRRAGGLTPEAEVEMRGLVENDEPQGVRERDPEADMHAFVDALIRQRDDLRRRRLLATASRPSD